MPGSECVGGGGGGMRPLFVEGPSVKPVDLMPDLHAIPGIWTPIKGYDGLLRRLRSLTKHGKIGEVLPVAYDWRL